MIQLSNCVAAMHGIMANEVWWFLLYVCFISASPLNWFSVFLLTPITSRREWYHWQSVAYREVDAVEGVQCAALSRSLFSTVFSSFYPGPSFLTAFSSPLIPNSFNKVKHSFQRMALIRLNCTQYPEDLHFHILAQGFRGTLLFKLLIQDSKRDPDWPGHLLYVILYTGNVQIIRDLPKLYYCMSQSLIREHRTEQPSPAKTKFSMRNTGEFASGPRTTV